MKVPTIALTFWKPSTLLIDDRRAGGDHQRADVGDVDLLVVDRVDDAGAGDGDEHFAGKQARRDGRNLAAGVVVQRVGAGAAVQEQHGAGRDAQSGDVGDVLVGAAVQGGDDSGRGVDERDVVVAAGGGVEREAQQSVGGDRDVDRADDAGTGDAGDRGRRVERHEVLVGDIGRLEVGRERRRGRVGELEGLEAADRSGPVGGAERLVGIAEVVEGVVDRRGRVGDRLQAGVIETREADGIPAVVEEDRAVLADLGEDGLIIGVVGLAGERAGGELAEDVQGVAVETAGAESAPALKIRPGVSTTGMGLPPLMSMFITWLPKSLVLMVSELRSAVCR